MQNMTLDEFREQEEPGLMEIFDFTSNIAISGYTDTTAVRIPEQIYSGCRIINSHYLSEVYLLNRKRSSLDLGVGYGVMRYRTFAARGSISLRYLAEEEDADHGIIRLPPYRHIRAPLGTVIRSRRSRRDMSGKQMKAADLSTILFYGDGVSGELEMASGNKDSLPERVLGESYEAMLRTAPSGGGLYPVTLYAAVNNVGDIPDGIYRYLPLSHALKRVGDKPLSENICEWGDDIKTENINACVFYVYSLYENSRKYLDMALDFALIETGQISENIHLTCTALDIASCDIGGFDKYAAEKLTGLDGISEYVLGVTVIGR